MNVATVFLTLLAACLFAVIDQAKVTLARFGFSALLMLLAGTVLAQSNSRAINIEVQHWNVEDGLAHRRVNTIFQDSKGFVWVGTRNGLNRFDGHTFRTYSKQSDELAGNDIRMILEDAEGWLWVLAGSESNFESSLSFINVQTHEVLGFEARFGERFPIDPQRLINMVVDEQGGILFSGENQIQRYHSGSFELVQAFDAEVIIDGYHKSLQTLLCHRRNPSGTAELYELKGKSIYSQQTVTSDKPDHVGGFYDHEGNAWLRIDDVIQFRNIHTTSWETTDLAVLVGEPNIQSSASSRLNSLDANRMLYSDKDFLIAFDPRSDFRVNIGQQYPAIFRANIRCVLTDHRDNAWIGTEFGLYKVKLQESPFTNYLNQPLEDYDVKSYFSSLGVGIMQGQLWANGREGDQFLIDLGDHSIKPLSFGADVMIPVPNPNIDEVVFYPIAQTAPNEHLTVDLNVVEFVDGKQNKVYQWKSDQGFDKSWSVFKDEGTIWLGLHFGGLGLIENDSIVRFTAYKEFESLLKTQTYHFLRWNEQHILLATSAGLYVLDPEKGIVQRFWEGGQGSTHLPFDNLFHLYRDKTNENLLWAATAGGGLLKIHLDAEGMAIDSVQQFTTVDGLANNTLYAVYGDNYNNLWLPSDYGLMRFDISNNEVIDYTTTEGLPFNEFNRIAHYQAEDGRLVFGTMNGVTTFFPKDLLGVGKSNEIPLQLLEFKQLNGATDQLEDHTHDLLKNREITVEPDAQFLILRFALLEYDDASRIRYSYQLQGQSDDWIYLNSNELRLSGLPYGDLTLQIRAQGADGRFSTQQLSIPVLVKRPIYLQWWFIVLVIIVFVLGTYSLYLYRTRRLRLRQRELENEVERRTLKIEQDKQVIETQAEELKNLDQLKSRFFANVSHELRTPLTLILAPVQELLSERQLDDRTRTNLSLVDKNSRRLQGMVNEILDLSKFESGQMTVDVAATEWFVFLKQLFASFDSLAVSNGISYELHYEGDQKAVAELDRSKVETVFNNLLSNAFKFTPKDGKITVNAGVIDQQLWFRVHDTGRGIAAADLPYVFDRYFQTKDKSRAAQGGTGIGLALAQELVKLLGGSIAVKSEEGHYTEFNVQLPYTKALDAAVNAPMPHTQQEEVLLNETEDVSVATSGSETVLLVEDNADLSLFIRSILEEYYAVITAENGQEALDLLAEHSSINLVVSDVMMPVMDGFQLLEKLKGDPKHRNLPIIMLTARASLQDKLHALRIGVDDYLTKPFVKEELLARMGNLLQNAQGRAEARLIDPEERVDDDEQEEEQEVTVENSETQQWLNRLEEVVLTRIELSEFSIDDLAAEMYTSKRQLYREIKQHIGVTPLQYVKEYKLNYARQLLETKKVKAVKVAALSIGYPNVVYFRREFKKAFGRLPSDYLA